MGERITLEIPDIYRDSLRDLADNEGLTVRQYVGLLLLRAVGNLEDDIKQAIEGVDGPPLCCEHCHQVHDGDKLIDCIRTLVQLLRVEREGQATHHYCGGCTQPIYPGVQHICPGSQTNIYNVCSRCGAMTSLGAYHACPIVSNTTGTTAQWSNMAMTFPCPNCGKHGPHNCA